MAAPQLCRFGSAGPPALALKMRDDTVGDAGHLLLLLHAGIGIGDVGLDYHIRMCFAGPSEKLVCWSDCVQILMNNALCGAAAMLNIAQ